MSRTVTRAPARPPDRPRRNTHAHRRSVRPDSRSSTRAFRSLRRSAGSSAGCYTHLRCFLDTPRPKARPAITTASPRCATPATSAVRSMHRVPANCGCPRSASEPISANPMMAPTSPTPKRLGAALGSGINVIDTAINYRHQRSERNIGAALKQAIGSGKLSRDEVLVCTKAGYLSFDGSMPPDPRGYFMREYVETGILDPEQLAGGMHCMAPAYLENQIERSRRNLGLEVIDVFYLHNPESQLVDVSRSVFHQRLKDAFAMLERQVKAGKLRYYGLATWGAFRVAEDARDSINLFEVVANRAGGGRGAAPFSLRPTAFQSRHARGLRPGQSRLRQVQRDVAALGGYPPGHRGRRQRHALPGPPHPGSAASRLRHSGPP